MSDLHHVDAGPPDAPAVLLIHGFSSSLHAWDAVARDLSADHRVVRVDLFGHGRTGGTARLAAPEQVAGVRQLLADLDLRDVVVVGHSFGAEIAVGAAPDQRVRAVVVIGQAPDYSTATLPRGRRLMTLPGLGPALHRLAVAPVVLHIARAAFAPGYDIKAGYDDPDRPVADHRLTAPGLYREVVVDRARRLAQDPLDAQLRRLDKPALAILGAQDQWYPIAPTARRYRDAGVEVQIVDGAGHSPNIERPELTAALLRAFVAGQAETDH